MIQEQFIEDKITEAIAKIDFSKNEYDSLSFVYGRFDQSKQIMINSTTLTYPVLIYILPQSSTINLDSSVRTYRTGSPILYLVDESKKEYLWSEFKTNVLNDLGVLKIQFLEALQSVIGKQYFGEINEYIHQVLSLKAEFLTKQSIMSLQIGGYEMQLNNLIINKKEICNG